MPRCSLGGREIWSPSKAAGTEQFIQDTANSPLPPPSSTSLPPASLRFTGGTEEVRVSVMCAHLNPNLKGREKRKNKSDSFGPKQQVFIMNGGVIMKEPGHFKKNKPPWGRQLCGCCWGRQLKRPFISEPARGKARIWYTTQTFFFFFSLPFFFFLWIPSWLSHGKTKLEKPAEHWESKWSTQPIYHNRAQLSNKPRM